MKRPLWPKGSSNDPRRVQSKATLHIMTNRLIINNRPMGHIAHLGDSSIKVMIIPKHCLGEKNHYIFLLGFEMALHHAMPRNSTLKLRFRNPVTIYWSLSTWSAFLEYWPISLLIFVLSKQKKNLMLDGNWNWKMVWVVCIGTTEYLSTPVDNT